VKVKAERSPRKKKVVKGQGRTEARKSREAKSRTEAQEGKSRQVKAEPKPKKENVTSRQEPEAQEGKGQGRTEAQEGKGRQGHDSPRRSISNEVEIPDIVPEETQLEVVIPVYSASVGKYVEKS
jgi:hypothetical protein